MTMPAHRLEVPLIINTAIFTEITLLKLNDMVCHGCTLPTNNTVRVLFLIRFHKDTNATS